MYNRRPLPLGFFPVPTLGSASFTFFLVGSQLATLLPLLGPIFVFTPVCAPGANPFPQGLSPLCRGGLNLGCFPPF